MRAKHTSYILLVLSVLFLIISYVLGSIQRIDNINEYKIKQIKNKFSIAIEKTNTVLKQIRQNDITVNVDNASRFLQQGIHTYIYSDNSPVFWSDNDLLTSDLLSLEADKVHKVGPKWIYINRSTDDSFQYVVALEIKSNYNVTNQYLKKEYNHLLRIPEGSKVDIEPGDKYISLEKSDGTILLYLKLGSGSYNKAIVFISAITFSLFYIFLFVSIYFALALVVPLRFRFLLSLVALGLILILTFFITSNLPDAIRAAGLFNPRIYASSKIFSSLGLVLLSSIAIFIIVHINVYHVFLRILPEKITIFHVLLYPVFLSGIIIYLFFTSQRLVFDSSIFLIPNDFSKLSIYSFVIYTIIGLNAFTLIISIQAFAKFVTSLSKQLYVQLSTGLLIFLILIVSLTIYKEIIIASLFVFFALGLLVLFYRKGIQKLNLVQVGIVLVLMTILTEYIVLSTNKSKETQKKHLIALDYAYEHDYVAEVLLAELDKKILSDSGLISLIYNTSFSYKDIHTYLKKNYFNGFWNKYDFQATICSQFDEVYVSVPDEEWYPCYDFFEELYKGRRDSIEKSQFKYISNHNGRITYFGSLTINKGVGEEITLFIELNSKSFTRSLGYPELLLDEKVKKYNRYEGYSLAKYYQGELVSSIGEYPYSLSPNAYPIERGEDQYFKFDNYDHLVIQHTNDVLVLVSHPVFSIIDKFIMFSYIFLFYSILLLALLVIFNIQYLKSTIKINFQRKIQLSILAASMVAFMLIGGATVFYSILQYRQKHFENISEKMRSVYIELDHKLSFEDEITSDWQTTRYESLKELLVKFSDVFYTDINLYYPDGQLMATSRPEIYERGLVGENMNWEAFEKMAYEKKPEYIHFEKIGEMRYLSGYVPFFNYDNKLLAYLNLPYFAFQNLLRSDVINLLVTVVNIYVLLILITLLLGFFLSQQVTLPLRFLQEKFKEINIGKKNQTIEYRRKDEIADIVEEYNRMVIELEKSIDMLARQERDLAWREMAKQIAHEIKNPLTPMKLSVQHLMKTIHDSPENIEGKIKKVSESLIKQIDNLSSIATAFSNFAKMPTAKMEQINLRKVIQDVEDLFDSDENVQFIFNYRVKEQAIVYGDKEQLIRVFTNIIKNAVQAIPEGKTGKIEVTMLEDENNYRVDVKDNGIGVSDELKDKLFEPNFTTKSSGMGLGLAIVKKIIENSSGKVYLNNKIEKGTVFTVELPKVP